MGRAARPKRTAKKGAPLEATAATEPLNAKCPICGKPAVKEFFPFSSRRCAEVDLNRWLSGSYAIPVVESEPDEEAPPLEIPTDEDEG